jgi:hypothetical protein
MKYGAEHFKRIYENLLNNEGKLPKESVGLILQYSSPKVFFLTSVVKE